MAEKSFIFVIAAMSVIQGITMKAKEKPLVPRLKYTSKGRHLDNPESVTYFLAKHNSEGFPNEILHRSLEDEHSEINNPSQAEMMEILSSSEAQRSLEEAALDYFADVLDGPEAHAAVEHSGRDLRSLCSYSWLSWVPWLDCPVAQRENKAGQLPSSQIHAQCVEPNAINYHTKIML